MEGYGFEAIHSRETLTNLNTDGQPFLSLMQRWGQFLNFYPLTLEYKTLQFKTFGNFRDLIQFFYLNKKYEIQSYIIHQHLLKDILFFTWLCPL